MMRKLLCVVTALCLCVAVALAEAKRFTLRFDEGFALSLPEGWVSYPAGEGPICYALGAGDGTRYLYILIQSMEIDGLRLRHIPRRSVDHLSVYPPGRFRFHARGCEDHGEHKVLSGRTRWYFNFLRQNVKSPIAPCLRFTCVL